MIRGRCPICAGHFKIAGVDDLPSFPFCSQRCRLIDLGRWIDGDYAIPESRVPDRSDDCGEEDDLDDPAYPEG